MTTPTMDFGDGHTWRKSRRSGDNGGSCVYVTDRHDAGLIGLRDSKEGAAGRPQWYSRDQWAAFLATVRTGALDHA